MDADCVVVGGGFAGLAAADVLAERGQRVVVLEARERVGGRTATVTLDDGTWVDVGGQWLGPTQDRMYALCRRFGRATYPMHTGGDNLLHLGSRIIRYRGHVPLRAPVATLANLAWGLLALEVAGRRVSLEHPWEAPRRLDQMTLGDWVRRHMRDPGARALVNIGIEAVFAAEPDEISLLHALFYMRSGGSFDRLTRSAGGAQQDRIDGGVQPLAEELATDIERRGAKVVLGAAVEKIEQTDNEVRVVSRAGTVRGGFAIVALPPPLAARVDYAPAVSEDRRQLWANTPMGSVIKCIAVYDEPFWRADGLSGQATVDAGPMRVAFDASPRNGRPGLLMGFFEGAEARRLAGASEDERRSITLATFGRMFGERARFPVAYVDRVWAAEEFSGGCYAALFPPGVWTRWGHVIREPHGRVHWAGTETATRWNGYIEGAVLSGERAAREVLARV